MHDQLQGTGALQRPLFWCVSLCLLFVQLRTHAVVHVKLCILCTGIRQLCKYTVRGNCIALDTIWHSEALLVHVAGLCVRRAAPSQQQWLMARLYTRGRCQQYSASCSNVHDFAASTKPSACPPHMGWLRHPCTRTYCGREGACATVQSVRW